LTKLSDSGTFSIFTVDETLRHLRRLFFFEKVYSTAFPSCHDNYSDNPLKKTKRFERPAFFACHGIYHYIICDGRWIVHIVQYNCVKAVKCHAATKECNVVN
jgi:hypothetical protein